MGGLQILVSPGRRTDTGKGCWFSISLTWLYNLSPITSGTGTKNDTEHIRITIVSVTEKKCFTLSANIYLPVLVNVKYGKPDLKNGHITLLC